ncbi:MAG: nucleotidyltransferase [Candidatus Hydrogenedentota bacterium]|nr:MAG: nucleotidyltransferase [Candidatus Hydrogenedentota bacterium]
MNHGLTSHNLEVIGGILGTLAPKITQVDLFGSRSTGNYRPNSDVDILLHGNLNQEEIDRLWTLFHESNLPLSVDITSYELTHYAPLKAHMDRVRKTLFTQQELLDFQAETSSDSDFDTFVKKTAKRVQGEDK